MNQGDQVETALAPAWGWRLSATGKALTLIWLGALLAMAIASFWSGHWTGASTKLQGAVVSYDGAAATRAALGLALMGLTMMGLWMRTATQAAWWVALCMIGSVLAFLAGPLFGI